MARKHEEIQTGQEYIAENKYNWENEDGTTTDRISAFRVMARRHEEIQTGQIKVSSGSRPNSKTEATRTKIMYSSMTDPKIQSDGMMPGSIRTTWEVGDKSDMEVVLEFHFAETLIKAVQYKKKDPEKKEIRYIQNAV